MGRESITWNAPFRSMAESPPMSAAMNMRTNKCGAPPGGSGSIALLYTRSGLDEARFQLRQQQGRLGGYRAHLDLHS